MNYLREILAFTDFTTNNDLTTGQIALWYALMAINNKTSWSETFSASNCVLETLTGLTRQAIVKNRNALKQKGLIDFKTNGTKATTYKIIPFVDNSVDNIVDNSLTMSNNLQVGLQASLQDSLQASLPLNKQETINSNIISFSPAREEENGRVWLRSPIILTEVAK